MKKIVNMEQQLAATQRFIASTFLCLFIAGMLSPSIAVARGRIFQPEGYGSNSAITSEMTDSYIGDSVTEVSNSNLATLSCGGPTQPEVQGFTPIGVSEMVDPFTGDFSYNIPLMDVEGYPINIAYSSGVSMDQEASWVGLGWNLNMGSVVRSMRGLPDDFDGDQIVKVESREAEKNISVDLKWTPEIWGNEDLITGIGSSVGLTIAPSFNFSNYTGLDASLSFGPSFSTKKKSGLKLNTGVTFTGSSENGAGFSPNFSLAKISSKSSSMFNTLGGNIGCSYNSRAGLQAISYGASLSKESVKSKTTRSGPSGSSSYSLGLNTYMPSSESSYLNSGISGNVSFGVSLFGLDGSLSVGLGYNVNEISSKQRINPAYGFFNLEKGQLQSNALLDFNRDNDGSFTKYTPNLPSAALTSDIFRVEAQGVGGSFKGFRNEVGYVFDPSSSSYGQSGSVGIELGSGNLLDFGVDLTGTTTDSYSGAWADFTNVARPQLLFEPNSGILERYALQEANEKSIEIDNLFTNQFDPVQPEYLDLVGPNMMPSVAASLVSDGTQSLSENSRESRLKRNDVMTFLTIREIKDGLGMSTYDSRIYSGAQDHHIGEITHLGMDGRRYVYGIPAYNQLQEDVTFSTGLSLTNNSLTAITPTSPYSGLVQLGSSFENLASMNNDRGVDHMYTSETTPGYAHAFLLTSVVSEDYIDSDGEKGPSENDFGTYVKFDYDKVNKLKWRTPIAENSAFFNEGLRTDFTDDKASFVYGEKDVWYVKAVETKNYIAIFTLEDRADGASAKGRQGGLNPGEGSTKCLKKISLYAKPADYDDVSDLANLTPIQEVHFKYDYSLCRHYAGNMNDGGKLTLKEIYFTYQGSHKMKRSSYKFDYTNNYDYNMKSVDRWGNYKPTASGTTTVPESADPLTNGEYPYAEQNPTLANQYAAAWALTDIHLPSGGKIHVDYESDDYAYVQHMKASQMFPIVALGELGSDMPSPGVGAGKALVFEPDPPATPERNKAIFFKLKNATDDVNDYAKPNQTLYFRCLVNTSTGTNDGYEFVSGYGKIETITKVAYGGEQYGKIVFYGETLKDSGPAEYSPIVKSAIMFGRMNLSRTISDNPNVPVQTPATFSEDAILDFGQEIANSISSLGELFKGPNKYIYDNGKCRRMVLNKSFIRLIEPSGKKLGGGSRVAQIKIFDNWDQISGDDDPNADYSYSYGQKFTYDLEDGTSSGVASYEPMAGGDENTWHQPYFYENKFRFAPDDKLFIESPIMESQFPSPSVGYSRVTITDLKPQGVNIDRTATGKVVKEFYTAKDFPTIVRNSDVDLKVANSFLPVGPQYNYLTASQGFSIVLNDMHGKPKSEKVYAEGVESPNSRVDYDYQKTPITYLGIPCFELDNSVKVITNTGTQTTALLGVKSEAVADFRQNETHSETGSADINFNSVALPPLFLGLPTVWPSHSTSDSRFRSATLTKVINKFGVQHKTTANQDGSIVETNNLAYDAETGNVLVTQTTTNFDDKVYSMSYPAYWKHDQMGHAYKNIGYTLSGVTADNAGFIAMSSANNYFVEGDEVSVHKNGWALPKKAWVTLVNGSGIRIQQEDGLAIPGSGLRIKVIRSGRRNKQSTSMASVTALTNPISGLTSGTFDKVLNAAAVEYKQDWNTYCNCFDGRSQGETWSPDFVNPYVRGTKGTWRPVKSYTYLTTRTQTTSNNNTNIRKDGVFESFAPYYKYSNGQWGVFPANWTFITEVTKFNPNGTTLETRDALGRYSASLFSYRNTLVTAIAINSSKRQLVEGSFEDLGSMNCMDQSIFSEAPETNISENYSHTGMKSLHVLSNNGLTFGTTADPCTPEPQCALTLNGISANSYSVLGGVSTNYSIVQNLISGTGSATISGNTLTINHPNTAYLEIVVWITNLTNKCELKVKFYTTGVNNSQFVYEILN